MLFKAIIKIDIENNGRNATKKKSWTKQINNETISKFEIVNK